MYLISAKMSTFFFESTNISLQGPHGPSKLIFLCQKRGETMADYAFRTLQARQNLQTLWEQGKEVKDLAEVIGVPLSTIYKELRRGRSGDRLPVSASDKM